MGRLFASVHLVIDSLKELTGPLGLAFTGSVCLWATRPDAQPALRTESCSDFAHFRFLPHTDLKLLS